VLEARVAQRTESGHQCSPEDAHEPHETAGTLTMLELLTDPHAWISLATLSVLEIVLGIDNIIFLSIVSARLPLHQQATARRIGLGLALLARVLLLLSLTWMIGLTRPIFEVAGFAVSWRDIVLVLGGIFLIVKGTIETHHMLEGHGGESVAGTATFAAVITQIVLLDLVFSLDSVITAIGIAEHVPIMVAAIVIAMAIMLLAAEPTARFVNAHPTVKMLALSFLLLVGAALVADGMHFHIPRGYLYFAIAFSMGVESLNLLAARARRKAPAQPVEKT
jgi:predicted tellurium resistance membrane protein TerC